MNGSFVHCLALSLILVANPSSFAGPHQNEEQNEKLKVDTLAEDVWRKCLN
jgi:hypothetical protein